MTLRICGSLDIDEALARRVRVPCSEHVPADATGARLRGHHPSADLRAWAPSSGRAPAAIWDDRLDEIPLPAACSSTTGARGPPCGRPVTRINRPAPSQEPLLSDLPGARHAVGALPPPGHRSARSSGRCSSLPMEPRPLRPRGARRAGSRRFASRSPSRRDQCPALPRAAAREGPARRGQPRALGRHDPYDRRGSRGGGLRPARGHGAGAAGRALEQRDAAARRDGDRQGGDRERDPPGVTAQPGPDDLDAVRRDSRNRCSTASSSATRRVRSRAPPSASADASSAPTEARCSWTRSGS